MKKRTLVVLPVAVLALALTLPALADDSQTVTITMSGASAVAISLDVTHWPLGEVAPDTEIYTVPERQWCTLTVTGNTAVNVFIVGQDATWVDDPSGYKWTLSNDGSNGKDKYGLWFCISGDNKRGPLEDGYVPITKQEGEFWPYDDGESLKQGDTRKFGLRLLTPSEFTGGKPMETEITLIAVMP